MMYSTKRTDEFVKWINNLKDMRAFAQITRRLTRIELGNLGDFKSLGDKVFELILLLIGGDKSSQKKNIEKAKSFVVEYGGHS